MSGLRSVQGAKAMIPVGQSLGRRALHLAIASSSVMLLVACGGEDAAAPAPAVASACSSAISNATGKWVTVVNNTFSPPGPAGVGKNYFSFNQPSINSNGTVVFRARAKAPAGGGGAWRGAPSRGLVGRSLFITGVTNHPRHHDGCSRPQ